MYIVHNQTTKTVILADLKAEIGPKKILDLERVAHRDHIDRSHNLRQAIQSRQLRLVKHSVVKSNKVVTAEPSVKVVEVEKRVEKTIERDKLDDDRLKDLIRQTIAEEISKGQQPAGDIAATVRDAVGSSVDALRDSIRDQLNNIQIAGPGQPEKEEQFIDPSKLAELQAKSINKITDDIETGGDQSGRKIKIKNSNVHDIANEL